MQNFFDSFPKEIKFWFKFVKLYISNILVAIDQLAGTLIGFDPDETISSVVGKNRNEWWAKWLADLLDWLDPRHTSKYKEEDEGTDSIWHFLKNKEKIKERMR